MARKKKDGLKRATLGLVGGSVILSTGSSIVGSVGGSTAASAQAGLGAAAGFLSPIGATVGAGLTVQQLRKLQKVSKRRRR